MNIRRFIPKAIRYLLFRTYADAMLDEAISEAEQMYEQTGRRHFVLPAKHGNLKVTDIDNETRDRKRDKRLLKRSVRKPWQLRRESYYFTPSDKCKRKFNPDRMQQWEADAMRKKFYEFYFQHH